MKPLLRVSFAKLRRSRRIKYDAAQWIVRVFRPVASRKGRYQMKWPDKESRARSNGQLLDIEV